ncbi:MAG: discoidin domain-containing protein [Planctomycetota bacterium]
MATPGYAVEIFKTSTYGGGHQIWFEVEDFDERDPPDDSSFALSDEPGAFGRSISSISGSDGASMIIYTFDVSLAGGKGGTWYFWGRVINPNNNSDFLLVEGHPGDPMPVTLPMSGLVNGHRVFEQSGRGPDWHWAPTAGDIGDEAHTKTLKDGENTMYILARESGAIWDVFMWTDSPDYVPTNEDYQNAAIFVGGSASDPSPADGAIDVPREVVLSWEAGDFAPPTNGHKVYFSTSFNDVNDRVGAISQSATSYAPPQRLDFGTTYYWRVDEVNGPPDYTVYEGGVWSFTTELLAYPIENIIATASSSSAGKGPENTINGSGLDDSGLLHGKVGDNNMWLSETGGPQPTWIEFEFDNIYKLHEMWVWNSNETLEAVIGFGFKDVTIEYSTNGVDYTTLGTTHEFARAPGAAGYAHNTTIDTGGIGAKYVRLTANNNWGGILPQFGLSEVRFLYIPVLAREPYPDSGSTDVSVDVTLGFRAGREAVTHDVYLSTDEQAVIDGTAAVATTTEASHGPLSLDLAQTYYWRVDEVNEAETPTTWQGTVWDFATQEYIVVDDFESYNDLDPGDPESNRIFLTWLDGYEVATNGSLVGYDVPPFAEQNIVHSDKQSMPLAYSNTGTAAYSEAERTFAVPQNWTKAGIVTMVLYFHGAPGNTGQLYVKVNDSKVVFDGDAADIVKPRWKQWNIDLASVGANLQNVTKLSIGIDGSGATGTLYIDDIRLYRLAPEVVVPSEEIWIEAESATTITAPMQSYDDPLASGGKYIGTDDGIGDENTNPPADGIATYDFTVQGGIYKIEFRVIITGGSNSFWVRIPGATNYDPGTDPVNPGWIRFNDIDDGDAWHWDEVHSSDHNNDVAKITLPAGPHTLEVVRREDGTLLDMIVISKVD